ncbi:MAG: hypothetical protein ABI353_11510 [Isosphaeraceae bacterium]
MFAHLLNFLKVVPGSIKGLLSNKDRAYALVTALSTGNIAGVVTVMIAAFGLNLSGPAVAVVTALFVAAWNAVGYLIDANRRKWQGVTTANVLDAGQAR